MIRPQQGVFLEMDGPNLTAPLEMFQVVDPHKATPGPQSRQSVVEGGRAALADVFQMLKKCPNDFWGDSDQSQPIHRAPALLCRKR
jgi:hypothetical protein